MPKSLNKLQIRAEILNAAKLLENGDKHSVEFLKSVSAPLLEIEDKNTVLDILIKEILSAKNDNRFLVMSYLLENTVPKELLEAELWKLLNQAEIDDRSKANIINILKDLGNQINYEKYIEYFENPDSIIDSDTEKMLKSAIYNPEALIDFLDFIEALPEHDRGILIDSLCEDYAGDELANLFIPVIYANPNSELCKYAIKRLGDSKSSLALRPLNWLLEFSQDDDICVLAKKSLSMLKLSGARFDKTDEFFDKILENTKLEDIFVSMPDGHGNVGILVSRKRAEKDSLQIFAAVFNDTAGIVDCFGFNDLTQNEFNRIVNRFYSNQEKICISAPAAKLLLENAEKLALKQNGRVSYEYVCWKRILADISPIKEDIETYLSKKLTKDEVTLSELEKVYATSLFQKWFLDGSENAAFLEFLSACALILSKEKNTEEALQKVNALILEKFDLIWDENARKQISYRMLLTSYLLYVRGLHSYANIVYSITSNEQIMNRFLLDIINISFYEFLLRERAKYQNAEISTNIFSRRNEANRAVLEKKVIENTLKAIENYRRN